MHVRRSLGRHLAGALTAPVFVLAACGGGDSVADPPVSSPPTSSPTQPPKHESPEHFIRRWAAAEKRMENTGDSDQYLALSTGCGPCEKLAKQVKSYYEAGGFVRWGGWQVLSISKYPGGPAPMFEVHSNSSPTNYKVSAHSPVRHFSGGSITYVLALRETHDSWTVTNKSELDA